VTPEARAQYRRELSRLEPIAKRVLARIDQIRQLLAADELPQNPRWDQEITPVRPSRYR